MKKLLIIFFLISLNSFLFCGWKLQKSAGTYKAYTQDGESKNYKIEAVISAPLDSVFKFLTGFEKFPDYYENIRSLKMIDMNDSIVYHYTIIKTPWPLDDRDMITKIRIQKERNNIVINSCSDSDPIFPESDKYVRVKDFREKLELNQAGQNETSMIITGSMKVTEKVPSWIIDKLILSGPVKTVEILNSLYNKGD
jgi:hypothetical protein